MTENLSNESFPRGPHERGTAAAAAAAAAARLRANDALNEGGQLVQQRHRLLRILSESNARVSDQAPRRKAGSVRRPHNTLQLVAHDACDLTAGIGGE